MDSKHTTVAKTTTNNNLKRHQPSSDDNSSDEGNCRKQMNRKKTLDNLSKHLPENNEEKTTEPVTSSTNKSLDQLEHSQNTNNAVQNESILLDEKLAKIEKDLDNIRSTTGMEMFYIPVFTLNKSMITTNKDVNE